MEHKESTTDKIEKDISTHGSIVDSKTSQLDDILNEKLEKAFHQQTSQVLIHEIAKIACEHDPIDLAHAVSRLPQSARPVVYKNLPDLEAKIIFIINTGSHTRSAIFRQLDDKEIVTILERTPPDEAVWLLDDLSDRRLRRVLEMMDPKKAARLKELHSHDRESAGRLMTNEFFAFNLNTTIGEVAKYIHDHPGIDLTRRIFVLNDDNQLIGYVPARNLIINPKELTLRQVMKPVNHKVTPDSSRDEVVDIMLRYDIPALPVVDENEHLVGVITYEDAVDALEDIADETIANIAGTGEDISEHEPVLKRFLWRAPWLIVTLLAGLVTSANMSFFQNRPWFIFVSFFVPMVNGFSGNVGIQCSTVLVRGISTGEFSLGALREAIGKEISIGALIGLAFGIVCAIAVYILNQQGLYGVASAPHTVAFTIFCGLFAACLTASCLGSFSPLAFARMGIDPAVASGPIVTAFNDVISTLMFLIVARLVSIFF